MFHPIFGRLRALQMGPLRTLLPLRCARRIQRSWSGRGSGLGPPPAGIEQGSKCQEEGDEEDMPSGYLCLNLTKGTVKEPPGAARDNAWMWSTAADLAETLALGGSAEWRRN